MKRYVIIFLCLISVFLSACAGNSSESDNDKTSNGVFNISDSSESGFQQYDNDEQYTLEQSINVFVDGEPAGFVLDAGGSEEQKLTLVIECDGGALFEDKEHITRIYLLEDGEPIEFTVGENTEDSAEYDFQFVPDKEAFVDVSFRLHKDFHTLTVLCVNYPDVVPEQGRGEMAGTICYIMQNSSDEAKSASQKINEDDYIKMPVTSESYGIDIGIQPVDPDDETFLDYHFNTDVQLTDSDTLYAKFNSGESTVPFYLYLIVDGRLVKAFDDNYSIYVDCVQGGGTFSYAIPDAVIPENGIHTFQMLALSAGNENVDYNTSRIRVNVDK